MEYVINLAMKHPLAAERIIKEELITSNIYSWRGPSRRPPVPLWCNYRPMPTVGKKLQDAKISFKKELLIRLDNVLLGFQLKQRMKSLHQCLFFLVHPVAQHPKYRPLWSLNATLPPPTHNRLAIYSRKAIAAWNSFAISPFYRK